MTNDNIVDYDFGTEERQILATLSQKTNVMVIGVSNTAETATHAFFAQSSYSKESYLRRQR